MNFESEKIKSGAIPPDNDDLKLRIQQMREFDEAKALSKEREFGDEDAFKELCEIAGRKDEYYIAKIKEREARSKK